MSKQKIEFGTGGWRGIIGDDFIKANVQRVAYAVCRLAREEGKAEKPIVIGYDRRFLSEVSSRWIAEVLAAQGIGAILVNRSTPTPLITVRQDNPRQNTLPQILSRYRLESYLSNLLPFPEVCM